MKRDMIIIDDPAEILDDERRAYLRAALAPMVKRVVIVDAPSSAMTAYHHEATVPNYHVGGSFGAMLEGWGERRVVVAPDHLREYFEPAFQLSEPVTHIRKPKVEAVPGNVKIANRRARRRNAAKARRAG